MKTQCNITETAHIRSEEEGQVSIILGTDGRQVKAKLLACAVQHAMNVGFDPDKAIKVNTSVSEDSDDSRFVNVSNSPKDVKLVMLKLSGSDVSEILNGNDLLKAIQLCSS